ncbi:MAG: hypothetical protein ACLQVD_06475 [Capsulimonadaceae bacterium]
MISILEETRDAVRDLSQTMQEYREDHMVLRARVDLLDAEREQARKTRQQMAVGGTGLFFTVAGSLITHLLEHLHH